MPKLSIRPHIVSEHAMCIAKSHAGWVPYCNTCTLKVGRWAPCLRGKWPTQPPPVLLDPELAENSDLLIEKARIWISAYEFARMPVPDVIREIANRVPTTGEYYRYAVMPQDLSLIPPIGEELFPLHQRMLLTYALMSVANSEEDVSPEEGLWSDLGIKKATPSL